VRPHQICPEIRLVKIGCLSFNTFANIVQDHRFWHGTADLRAKLVLGAPNGNAKHRLGKGIGEDIVPFQHFTN